MRIAFCMSPVSARTRRPPSCSSRRGLRDGRLPFRSRRSRRAVAPRYPMDAKGHLIDLTAINSEGKAFIQEAARCIKQKVERLYEPGMDVHETRHISLFALAPIPLLVYLGSQLSNKVPVDVFQRHRDTEDLGVERLGLAGRIPFRQNPRGQGARRHRPHTFTQRQDKARSTPGGDKRRIHGVRADAREYGAESDVFTPAGRSHSLQDAYQATLRTIGGGNGPV